MRAGGTTKLWLRSFFLVCTSRGGAAVVRTTYSTVRSRVHTVVRGTVTAVVLRSTAYSS